jgi:hypothetical protein
MALISIGLMVATVQTFNFNAFLQVPWKEVILKEMAKEFMKHLKYVENLRKDNEANLRKGNENNLAVITKKTRSWLGSIRVFSVWYFEFLLGSRYKFGNFQWLAWLLAVWMGMLCLCFFVCSFIFLFSICASAHFISFYRIS